MPSIHNSQGFQRSLSSSSFSVRRREVDCQDENLKIKRIKKENYSNSNKSNSKCFNHKALHKENTKSNPAATLSLDKADNTRSKLISHSSPSLSISSPDSINLLELLNNTRKSYRAFESEQIFNNNSDRVLHSTFLRPGSCFAGKQLYKNNGHEVSIKFKHVDLNQSYLNGYLTIKKLTKENPEITTFFEAEIISEKHNFLSRRKTSNLHLHDQVDLVYWSKFPSWKAEIYPKVVKQLHNNDVIYKNNNISNNFGELLGKSSNLYCHKNFLGQRYIYMRWKEVFLVPDATKRLERASYDGLYYICLDQKTGLITGYYFHQKVENQFLEVLHVPDGGFSESFEFV